MCTRFVFRGDDIINGFDFDIDLDVWEHRVISESDRLFIGILMPDGRYHSYHGVNRNGNVGTLLYVHGNEAALPCVCDAGSAGERTCTIAAVMEGFIRGELSFDDAVRTAETERITYAPGATMQGMLSDHSGRTLIIEPGNGYRIEDASRPYSLITNYSLLSPETTRDFITPGDDRFERAQALLDGWDRDFSVQDAWSVLEAVHAEGPWATRVSFVHSQREQAVYVVENNQFGHVKRYDLA